MFILQKILKLNKPKPTRLLSAIKKKQAYGILSGRVFTLHFLLYPLYRNLKLIFRILNKFK